MVDRDTAQLALEASKALGMTLADFFDFAVAKVAHEVLERERKVVRLKPRDKDGLH